MDTLCLRGQDDEIGECTGRSCIFTSGTHAAGATRRVAREL
jgi:hypothetical protein